MLRPPIEPMLARLARELPAGSYFYEPKWDGFRCLAVGEDDARHRPFEVRRTVLEELLGPGKPRVVPTPITRDIEVAREWLRRFQGKGIDGVVAKDRALPYQAGRRAMVKVKNERTADRVL